MLDFAVHQLAGYRLLARTCPVDTLEIRQLWELVGADRDRGLLTSDEPDVGAVGATLARDGGALYVAGVPAAPEAEIEGYEPLDVPGGPHAMVTYSGSPEHVTQVLEALRDAIGEAGEALTGDSIEVYRGLDDDGRTVVDLGFRLAEP